MECEYCEITTGKEDAMVVYEDDHIIGILNEKGVTPGQLTILTKEHFPIIEVIPDDVISRMFQVANGLSMALFQALHAQGTNIIVQNGLPAGQTVPHFAVTVVPRREGDAIDFSWTPKQVSQEDLQKVAAAVKSEMETLTSTPVRTTPVEEAPVEKITDENGESYLVKHLRRIP
jgi:histidine triad (HIT) family protein